MNCRKKRTPWRKNSSVRASHWGTPQSLLNDLDGFSAAPDGQQQEKLAELTPLVAEASASVKGVSDDLAALNKKMNDAGIPHIVPAPPRPRTGPGDGEDSDH